MNTLLSQELGIDLEKNQKDNEIASDLLEDIDNADEFLMNQKAFALELNSAHSSKRKNSSEINDFGESSSKKLKISENQRNLQGKKKLASEKGQKPDSLSFTSNSEDEMLKKGKLDELEIESHFLCSSHASHPIKYFCIHESVFLCNVCKLDHLDHKEAIKDYNHNNLNTEVDKLNDKLVNVKHILSDFQSKIKSFLEEKVEFITSNQINSLFRSSYAFFSTPSMTQIQPYKKTIKTKEFFIESNLIKNVQDEKFILGLFSERLIKSQINLLYQASKDGFNAKDFHRFCDRKGPTLVIIKSEKDCIFGGYTSKAWKSKEKGEFQSDEKAFLFSLTKKTKHEINENYTDKAIYFANNRGPVFGSGFDLLISEKCDQDEESFSNLGISYECEEDMTPEEIRKHLGGEIHFRVKEIEVFGLLR